MPAFLQTDVAQEPGHREHHPGTRVRPTWGHASAVNDMARELLLDVHNASTEELLVESQNIHRLHPRGKHGCVEIALQAPDEVAWPPMPVPYVTRWIVDLQRSLVPFRRMKDSACGIVVRAETEAIDSIQQ